MSLGNNVKKQTYVFAINVKNQKNKAAFLTSPLTNISILKCFKLYKSTICFAHLQRLGGAEHDFWTNANPDNR